MSFESGRAPIKLGTLGMDERALDQLRAFLSGPGDKRAELVADLSDADVCLIDLDHPDGESLYARQRGGHPELPCILLALNPQIHSTDGDRVYVQKPAQSEPMLAALEQVCASVLARQSSDAEPSEQSPSFSARTPEDAGDNRVEFARFADQTNILPQERALAKFLSQGGGDIDSSAFRLPPLQFYDPAGFLQGYVMKACERAFAQNSAVTVHPPWKPLSILPKQRKIWVDADEVQLRAACSMPLRKITSLDLAEGKRAVVTVSKLAEEEAERLSEDPRAFTMDELLWKIGLWTSKGRLPRGIDLSHEVKLARWPNLTHLSGTLHSLRIASLLQQKPCTLLEVTDSLGVPQQNVFAFFTAAWTAGMVELQEPGPVIPPLVPEVAPDRLRPASLIGRIIRRLKMR